VTALMTILGCGITYLILRSKSKPIYAGLDFSTEDGWERLESIVSKIIHAVLNDIQLKPLSPSKKASADTLTHEKRHPQQHKMLDISFEEIHTYAKGRLDMVLELLELNCGQLKVELVREVTALPIEQLNGLARALLKFRKAKDLEKWLQENVFEES
jgi:Domain of unknown function (DUF4351)